MKTDRLLSIVIHLLNNDTVSAAKLADRFEVSKRTILRDIAQISQAGIPIASLPGVNGGYSIMKGYKLDGRLVSAEDQDLIITALKGFASAYGNKQYSELFDKISSVFSKRQERHIFLDFGATGEDGETQRKLELLEGAIVDKKAVKIQYVGAAGAKSQRIIEPLALSYRWYAWYLLAYCRERNDYRIFKLTRIFELTDTNLPFYKEHGDSSELLEKVYGNMGGKEVDASLLCKAEMRVQICEYLDGTIVETLENGDFILEIHPLEDERMWYAMLLSFGDAVTVLKPEALKIRLRKTAENILSLYRKW